MELKQGEIRVCLMLTDGIHAEERHFISPMTHIPRKGDLINVDEFVDESMYSEDGLKYISNLSWSVWFVSWEKDKDGYFVLLCCSGE